MEWQPEDSIDNRLRRLIDPEQPLRRNDIFLPSMNFSILYILVSGFWFSVFITGTLVISYELLDKFVFVGDVGVNKGLPGVVSIILLLAGAFAAYKSWHSLSSRLKQRELFKNGRYRNGMFILKNAILLHSFSQIFLIEKENILDFHIPPKGRGEPSKLLIVMQKNEEERINIDLSTLDIDYTANELKGALMHWMKTGVWEIH